MLLLLVAVLERLDELVAEGFVRTMTILANHGRGGRQEGADLLGYVLRSVEDPGGLHVVEEVVIRSTTV